MDTKNTSSGVATQRATQSASQNRATGAVHFDVASMQQAIASGDVVLVDFWAAWCGPCRAIAPTIDRIAREFAGRATVGKLEIDHAQDLAQGLGVHSIPSLLVWKNGVIVDRLVGVTPHAEIAERLGRWTGA